MLNILLIFASRYVITRCYTVLESVQSLDGVRCGEREENRKRNLYRE